MIRTYHSRRQQLLQHIGSDGLAILFAAPEQRRSNDTEFPFRQDSYLHYLSGFPEPQTALILDGASGDKGGDLVALAAFVWQTKQGEAGRKLASLARPENPLLDVPAEDARDAHWVEPTLVGEVHYSGVTDSGRLWHPVWRGWRPDLEPVDVTWEIPT